VPPQTRTPIARPRFILLDIVSKLLAKRRFAHRMNASPMSVMQGGEPLALQWN
jgi:hypothetical protein